MKKNWLSSVSMMLLSVLTLGIVNQGFAAAATTTKTTKTATPNTSSTLKVSPLRTDLSIAPGQSAMVDTSITNLSTAPMTIKIVENDFVAGDEKGTPALILDENSYAPTHSLKRFMQPITNVTVNAGASQKVSLKVTVPKDAQAGGYFGALRFMSADGDNSKSVSLNGSVASLILLTVPGPVTERLTLTNFDVQQNGGTASNFRTSDNLGVFVRFENKGNIQEGPFGQIYVKKGTKIVYSYNLNQKDPKDMILPDSARRWDVPLKGMGKFGKYTVGATMSYGSKGKSIEITKTIWIIPTFVILVIVISVIVVALLVLGMWFFLRNYKRRILKSSRRRY